MKATITDISFVFKILCNEVKKNDMKYTALIVNLFDEQHLACPLLRSIPSELSMKP